MKTIYLAGGCFWGTQRFFDQFSGVLKTEVGYANGKTANPSYEQVRYENTGHAETVKIEYDDQLLPTEKLIEYYFLAIDPLALNHQGEDYGTQYRTGIYYEEDALLEAIEAVCREKERELGQKLAVEIAPLENFYRAEEYHQDYLVKNPGGYCHIPKKLFELETGKPKKP